MGLHQTGEHLQYDGAIDGKFVNDVGNEEVASVLFRQIALETLLKARPSKSDKIGKQLSQYYHL